MRAFLRSEATASTQRRQRRCGLREIRGGYAPSTPSVPELHNTWGTGLQFGSDARKLDGISLPPRGVATKAGTEQRPLLFGRR